MNKWVLKIMIKNKIELDALLDEVMLVEIKLEQTD